MDQAYVDQITKAGRSIPGQSLTNDPEQRYEFEKAPEIKRCMLENFDDEKDIDKTIRIIFDSIDIDKSGTLEIKELDALFDLLQRFYDPDAGTITMIKRDIRELSLSRKNKIKRNFSSEN